MEMKVKENSFWAKYEGMTTCNANSVLLVKVVLGLLALSVLVFLGYFMFTNFWVTVVWLLGFFVGGVLCFLSAAYGEQVIDSIERGVIFFFTLRPIKFFFYYGFYWLWKPLQKLGIKIDGKLQQVSILAEEKARARRLSSSVEKEAKDLSRAKKIRERNKIWSDFWRLHTRDFLTHTLLMGLILGGVYFNLALPGSDNLWAFGLYFLGTLLASWLIVTAVMFIVISFSLPFVTRLYRKVENTVLFKLFYDVFHFVCRRLVVEYKVFGDVLMRRADYNPEAINLVRDGLARIVLCSNGAVKKDETNCCWNIYCKEGDIDIREILESDDLLNEFGMQYVKDGWFCVQIWRDLSFEQLYGYLKNPRS